MGNVKAFIPIWVLNIGIITATSIGETLNLVEQVLKIALILLTAYFTYKIGRKKLKERKEKETEIL